MNSAQAVIYLNKFGYNLSKQQIEKNSHKTVVIGMSGGVDSSVVALIIKLMGYKAIGMFMKNWEEIDEHGKCSSEDDYNDVIKVCEHIDIPYYSLNFSEEYKQFVFTNFLEEYKNGHTPNPDILCNKEIKFKVFYDKAKEFGADYLATGHYCQTKVVGEDVLLAKGFDKNKDQSYFLHAINGTVLKDILFPLGHLEKNIVRQIAKDFNLATFAKKDSTGICFIGERNFKQFLSKYISSLKGDFIHLDSNRKLGEHDGICFYTNGQRKGLGLGGPGGPWFVASKDIENNIVYIVEGERHPALYADDLIINELTWIKDPPKFPFKCTAKIRYRQADQKCTIYQANEADELKVVFDEPQRAISLRQSVVFYQDTICLGGGVVKEAGESYFSMNKSLPISGIIKIF